MALEINDLAIDLYVAGELVTPPGMRYAVQLRERTQVVVQLIDQNEPAWGWRLQLMDLTRLDDHSDRPGWCGITAAVFGIDGSMYAPFRPFLFYASRWVYPTLLAWPDAYKGPIVVALSVPGLPEAGTSEGQG
jgi:hypothetical protein